MADRGAAIAVLTAPESVTSNETYQHPMEPTANFGTDFTAIYFGPW